MVSAIQAATGNVAVKGVSAHIQSAAMGGYGASAVNGITSAGAGVFGLQLVSSMLESPLSRKTELILKKLTWVVLAALVEH
jgi:hypothetical protein